MSTRPYTTLQRITIEAVDCVIKQSNDPHGHLNIFIEPKVPVAPIDRSSDPLLTQATIQQETGSTPTSASVPETVTTKLVDTLNSQAENSSVIITDNRLSSLSPIHSIDTDDEIEEIQPVSKDDIEDNDNYNTPPSNTPPPTSMTQQDTTQTQTSHRVDVDMSEYIKCPRFQEKFKSIKTDLGTDICNAIAREPEKMRNWFLQVICVFPDLLDDKCGPTVQYIATDRGFIQINQPSYDVTFEPDTTQTEQNPVQDDTQQEKCHDQSEVTQASQPQCLGQIHLNKRMT